MDLEKLRLYKRHLSKSASHVHPVVVLIGNRKLSFLLSWHPVYSLCRSSINFPTISRWKDQDQEAGQVEVGVERFRAVGRLSGWLLGVTPALQGNLSLSGDFYWFKDCGVHTPVDHWRVWSKNTHIQGQSDPFHIRHWLTPPNKGGGEDHQQRVLFGRTMRLP